MLPILLVEVFLLFSAQRIDVSSIVREGIGKRVIDVVYVLGLVQELSLDVQLSLH